MCLLKFLVVSCALTASALSNGPLDCNFETECDYRSSEDPGWKTDFGPNYPARTGPEADHTQGEGGRGYYAYMDASEVKEHKSVLLTSLSTLTAGEHCLTFFYSMHGAYENKLNVYLFLDDNSERIKRIEGDQGREWLESRITIGANYASYHIVFEAVRGQFLTGDVAIDDITVSSGACPPRDRDDD